MNKEYLEKIISKAAKSAGFEYGIGADIGDYHVESSSAGAAYIYAPGCRHSEVVSVSPWSLRRCDDIAAMFTEIIDAHREYTQVLGKYDAS